MYIYQIMSNSFGYIDIILLGMIAGFIILRLLSILCRKTGHESKFYPNFTEQKFTVPKNNVKRVKDNYDVLEGEEKKDFLKGYIKIIPQYINEIQSSHSIEYIKNRFGIAETINYQLSSRFDLRGFVNQTLSPNQFIWTLGLRYNL